MKPLDEQAAKNIMEEYDHEYVIVLTGYKNEDGTYDRSYATFGTTVENAGRAAIIGQELFSILCSDQTDFEVATAVGAVVKEEYIKRMSGLSDGE